MKGLVHKRFQGIIFFPKSSSGFYYYKTGFFQKIGQKIAMVGEEKKKFLQYQSIKIICSFPCYLYQPKV